MPLTFTKTTGDTIYPSPFIGSIPLSIQIQVNCTALTNAEIDAKGYLKPGVPLTKAGALVGAAPAFCYGVTIEPLKVATGNTAPEIAAAPTNLWIGVAVYGAVQQDLMEDILGRVLTANELAGLVAAGCKLVFV